MGTSQSDADRQLPIAEEIFLDHVAHFVPDRDSAVRALHRAGFATAPVSIQVNAAADGGPARLTGTGNVTAMFKRGYIEVLFKTAETPLGHELDAALARHVGVHLAAFSVADAAAARERLAGAGFRLRPLAQMQRPVDTEGGEPGTAAFTLARLEPGEMPEGRMQILTHRTEHMVWQPRWLSHSNGALALTRLIIAVADPAEAAERFGRLTGRQPMRVLHGHTLPLDRGRLDLMTEEAFARLLPEVAIPALPFVGAYGVRVRSLAALGPIVRGAGLQQRSRDQGLVVPFPPELGRGAWLFAE
ncbi:MAG: VOC family protein [Xanthobacteraceae bacterium]